MDPADLIFLALCLWRECRGESFNGKAAVASVILNRVKRGGWWGNDVMGVVTKPWQFSGMTAKNDPNLHKWPTKGAPDWEDCILIAKLTLEGSLSDNTQGATYYHDTSIGLPDSWGEVELTVQVGRLLFYRGA